MKLSIQFLFYFHINGKMMGDSFIKRIECMNIIVQVYRYYKNILKFYEANTLLNNTEVIIERIVALQKKTNLKFLIFFFM